jgi:hypothetical protein
VTSQNSCDPGIVSLIVRSTQATHERADCRLGRKSVGWLYTSGGSGRRVRQKNKAKLPFLSFGTPVAYK